MGVDITAFVEVKHETDWLLFGEINPGRRPDLFHIMRDVAGGQDRGLPRDASWATEQLLASMADHSFGASWLAPVELCQVQLRWWQHAPQSDDPFGWLWQEAIGLNVRGMVSDYRLVYWFSN
jgi:hypothetical protein